MKYKRLNYKLEDKLVSEYLKEHEQYFEELFHYISERDRCRESRYNGMRADPHNGNIYYNKSLNKEGNNVGWKMNKSE